LVVLVGQKKAIAIAVRNFSGRRRWSKLREWLTGAQNFCMLEPTPESIGFIYAENAIAIRLCEGSRNC